MFKKTIISLAIILALLIVGCHGARQSKPSQNQNREPAYISDQYGLKLYDLDGYSEDKSVYYRARAFLTLRKDDVRVQFGFIKGENFPLLTDQNNADTAKQMLLDWTTGMLETPNFFPGTDKILLKWEYTKISGNLAIVTDILLESSADMKSPLSENMLKLHKEDIDFFKVHKKALLRTYHMYRGKDMFHIEFLADPLTYQAEIGNFEKTILDGISFMEKSQ